MNLVDKIEEIKRKPEHIRLRYVWFFVAISMMGVLTIWFLSFRGATDGAVSTDFNSGLRDVAGQLNDQKDSMQATINSVKTANQDALKKMSDGGVK